MKILITGASGLLGRAIKKEFEKVPTWQILGLAYSRLGNDLQKVDLQNNIEIVEVLNDFKPDIVVHSAAERRPDFVSHHEKETEQLNVTATEIIAKTVNKLGGFMLYISTDYVFDGTSPPYKTTDQPNPLNKYGVTKLEGEKRTMENCKHAGVLRVPILYGGLEYVKESAVTGLLTILQESTTKATVSNYELRYPTSTADIAVICRQTIEHRQKDQSFSGIWHWRSDDKLTKYGMIEKMSKLFNLSMNHIHPSNEPTGGAPRPFDCEFDCSDLEAVGIGQRTSFDEGIKECLQTFL